MRMCVRASVHVCGHQIKVGIVFTQHRWYCVLPLSHIHLHSTTRFSHYRFSLMTQICSDVLTEGYKSASEATCRRQPSEEAYTYVWKGTFSGFGCEWKDGFSSQLQKASSNNELFPPKYLGCQAAWKFHSWKLSDWPLNVSQKNSRYHHIQKLAKQWLQSNDFVTSIQKCWSRELTFSIHPSTSHCLRDSFCFQFGVYFPAVLRWQSFPNTQSRIISWLSVLSVPDFLCLLSWNAVIASDVGDVGSQYCEKENPRCYLAHF